MSENNWFLLLMNPLWIPFLIMANAFVIAWLLKDLLPAIFNLFKDDP